VAFATYRRGGNGLDYAMNRYYDPARGRFTTPDPYGEYFDRKNPISFNRYAYVMGDPVNKNDPTGLDTVCISYAAEDGKGELCYDTPPGANGVATDSNGNQVGVAVEGTSITVTDSVDPATGMPSDPGNQEASQSTGWGYMGQAGQILATAGNQAGHDMGCVGLGGAIAGTSIGATAQIIPKRFSQGGTDGTSLWSKVVGKSGPIRSTPSPVGTPGIDLTWQSTGFAGRLIGRYLPYLGTIAGLIAANSCLNSNP
jgi:RHS repeat-associated protein